MIEETVSAVRGLCAAETPSDVYSATVTAADALLPSEVNEVAIAEEEALIIQAQTTNAVDCSRRSYPRGLGIPGGAYAAGEACLIADCLATRSSTSKQDTSASDTETFRSMLCVPMDNQGIFVAKARPPESLTERDQDIAEELVVCAETALDRIQSTSKPLWRNGGAHHTGGGPDRLEEIAQILSHDVKSPLNVAQGSLELAKETGADKHWNRTATALSRIEELIDSVVLLARTGEHVDFTEPVEFEATVTRAWETLPTDEATLVISDSAILQADRQALSQLLENLIGNAITHAGPEVTVTVGAYEDGFYVEDDGPGIPPEDRDDIFDRGYSSAEGHSGLGLSIAQRLAEAHGWRLSLSDGEENGTRFEITGVQVG